MAQPNDFFSDCYYRRKQRKYGSCYKKCYNFTRKTGFMRFFPGNIKISMA
jgi:hypothetical protein